MDGIGGNVTATLKYIDGYITNAIGEDIPNWAVYKTITGFLDFASQSTGNTIFNAKMEESTHMFICDYVSITIPERELIFVLDGKEYDVKLIDDPMNLHDHLEIFLAYVGE